MSLTMLWNKLLLHGEFSSIESGDDDEQGDTSMMAVESEAAEYASIFTLMAKSDDDND